MSTASEAIRAAIRANGPITFAEYMEIALYDPEGFYGKPPVGFGGDFVTSPHIHRVFGELLGEAIRELWDRMGRPTPLRLAEVGAGDGSLAMQLAGSGDVAMAYTAIERSPRARDMLSTITGVEAREDLTGPVDVVLCNELLDNLPFRVLRGDREVRIGLDGGRLVEILVPAESGLPASSTAGEDRIVPVGAFAFLDTLAEALERGYALIIDYGGLGTTGGPVHGYSAHAIVEDLLAEPGTTDITCGVDVELIASRAEDRGLVSFPSVTQHDALLALGLEDWMRGQLEWQRTQLDVGDGRDAVRTWSGRSRATLLVDPGGLGRLRWLLLATPGLAPPTWLERASSRSTD